MRETLAPTPELCKTLRMEMNLITQPVPTRASSWMFWGPNGTAEFHRNNGIFSTTWEVVIYKNTDAESIEEVDSAEFDDVLLAEQWAVEQI